MEPRVGGLGDCRSGVSRRLGAARGGEADQTPRSVAYYVLSTPRRYADKTQDYCMVLDAVCSGQPGLTHVLYEVRGRLRASAQM